MKRLKKLTSLLLALVMVFAMSATAFAADTTISVNEDDAHSYDVYQIFTGDLENGVLKNVKWGKNGTGNVGDPVDQSILDGLEAVNTATNTNTTKLAEIKKYVNLESVAFGTVNNTTALNAPTGYYLFVDKGALADGEGYSLYVVEVVGPTTIAPKRGEVTSEKKVKDTDDTAGTTTAWQDSADYDIGDVVPFQLKGTVPADYANYKTYYYAFHDVESEGLTFNKESVKVFVDGTQITSGFEVKTEDLTDGCTFEVVFDNLKGVSGVEAGSTITVEYISTLNEEATLGSTGNPNTMHLEFSNNPNWEGQGKPDTGETPDDTVIVFTYKVVVDKVDQDGKKLPGAEFKLEKKVGNEWKELTLVKNEDGTVFSFKGLDDGQYRITETTHPAGYNSIEPIEFTVTANHEIKSDDPALKELAGGDLFTGEVKTGEITGTIVNQKGATLPETGGIGTTMFYVIGAILVVGAAVVMITKKRMSR